MVNKGQLILANLSSYQQKMQEKHTNMPLLGCVVHREQLATYAAGSSVRDSSDPGYL
jgi:hypothetical protein